VDTVNGADGRKRFILGPVEVGIVAALPTLLLALLVWNWRSSLNTIEEQGRAIATLSDSVVLMQEQMRVMNLTFAGIPALNERVSRLEVRMDNAEEKLAEQRQMRGLR
jgi:hypothetical protein